MLKELCFIMCTIGALANPTYIGNSAVYSTTVESTSGGYATIYVVDNDCDGTTDNVYHSISELINEIEKLYE